MKNDSMTTTDQPTAQHQERPNQVPDIIQLCHTLDVHKRAELVRHAATKPVRKLIQFDYMGDECFSGPTDELRHTDGVRLQFSQHWTQAEVLEALKDFTRMVQEHEFPTIPRIPCTLMNQVHEAAKRQAAHVLSLAKGKEMVDEYGVPF